MMVVDVVPIWEAEEARRGEWPQRGRVRVWTHVRGAKGKVKKLCEELLEGGWTYKVGRESFDTAEASSKAWKVVKRFEQQNANFKSSVVYAEWVGMARMGDKIKRCEAYVVEYWREGEDG